MEQVIIFALLLPYVMSSIRVVPLEDDYDPPQPYTFGYKVHDKEGDQWRSETSDGLGKVEGSYGYVDSDGLRREVHYIADDDGFRASIKTNEPGMDVKGPADVLLDANPPSDYDATVYGIEAMTTEVRPRAQAQIKYSIKQETKPSIKIAALPSEPKENSFQRYPQIAEQTVPPIYIVDGHLQSPWFPMESNSAS